MRHDYPNEFKKPNKPFGVIVKDEHACNDLCNDKAPKCGGWTYFSKAQGKRKRGQCLLKVQSFHKYRPNSAAISRSLSCPGTYKSTIHILYTND